MDSTLLLENAIGPHAFKASVGIFEFLIEGVIASGAWLWGLFGLGAGGRVLCAGRRQFA